MPSFNPAISAKAVHFIPYTLYYGTFVQTPDLGTLEVCFNTLVGVNDKGVIDFLEKEYFPAQHNNISPLQHFLSLKEISNRERRNVHYVDYSHDANKFFVPGFVDTHIHASQFPNIGIGLDSPLLDWLTQYTFPLEREFTDSNPNKLKLAQEVYSLVINKTISSGTTCASYFTTTDPETTNLFGELLLKFGQRGFVGKVCMDHNETYDYKEDFETCVESMERIISHIERINPDDERLVTPIITPRFAPVCTSKQLKYLAKLSSERKLPIQTHIGENEKEVELVKEMFPDCTDYASVYDDHDLLNSTTILAHAVHLTRNERKLIKEKNCSISHCPASNTFISSGEAPITKYLYDDEINVSLGTDVSGGFESSILGVIKHSILVSHHLSMRTKRLEDKLTIEDAIYMATKGGAIAVGLNEMIGTFDLGKKFDVQLIDLNSRGSNVDVFDWQLPSEAEHVAPRAASDDSEPLSMSLSATSPFTDTSSPDIRSKKMKDLLGKWVFSGDDRNCVKVWCNGRVVVDKEDYRRNRGFDEWVMVDK